VSEIIVIFLQVILSANTAAFFRSLLGLVPHLLRLHVKPRSAKTRQPILTSLNRLVYMSAEVIHVWQTRR